MTREHKTGPYSDLILQIERIAMDPEETPTRRRIARRCMDDLRRPSYGVTVHNPGHSVVGNHRGGFFHNTDLTIEGYNDNY